MFLAVRHLHWVLNFGSVDASAAKLAFAAVAVVGDVSGGMITSILGVTSGQQRLLPKLRMFGWRMLQ